MSGTYVTGELIKSAVALRIRQAFAVTAGDPPVTLYPVITKERTVQGHETPSFFIWQLNMSQEEVAKDVFERTYQMNVRYFPEESTKMYEQLDNIGNQLLEALRYIDVPLIVSVTDEGEYVLENRKVRGAEMDYKIQDDVLQAFANYTIRVKLPKEELPGMETLAINESIKN